MAEYPSAEEFRNLLLEQDHQELLNKYVFAGVPFIFRDSERSYDRLLDHISNGLAVPKADLTLVGSGRIGFSLSPSNYGRRITDESDLDILVVSEALFDRSWIDLLRFEDTLGIAKMTPQAKEWVRDHQRRYIYRGWVVPEQLVGVTSISTAWFNVFRSVSRYPELADRNVDGRLYRTWDHVRLYHLRALGRIIDQEALP